MSWKINVFAERCTGCQICQMICSWASEKNFQPLHAYIQVKSRDGKEAQFDITFVNRCKKCGLCASYCSSGALVKERQVPNVV
ncbi:4Fe-4S dicluster domain-containing protein [Desulfoscipio gibsoniae]|uniref:2-oxoacid:ferredoxin oxidoreductase, delta subunit n=1 Tax=Desulfoscipio gibsoniae DSM 7213 TaxID=767817 RepID=R4KA66_9FIRM|nr:2-oxoacid:ferredoxin oxidoreductase, delta subunit [Desulfoscipio gibsoniae DSM 7213]